MIDQLTVSVVVQPKLWVDYKLKMKVPVDGKDPETRIETDEEFNDREEKALKSGAIAVRNIALEDKVWLMNWAMGGISELAAFR